MQLYYHLLTIFNLNRRKIRFVLNLPFWILYYLPNQIFIIQFEELNSKPIQFLSLFQFSIPILFYTISLISISLFKYSTGYFTSLLTLFNPTLSVIYIPTIFNIYPLIFSFDRSFPKNQSIYSSKKFHVSMIIQDFLKTFSTQILYLLFFSHGIQRLLQQSFSLLFQFKL